MTAQQPLHALATSAEPAGGGGTGVGGAHLSNAENPKDFLERIEADPRFKRFMWSMRLSRLLAERGLVDIELAYDEATEQWCFSLRWGTFKVRQPKALEWTFRAAVAKLGRKVRDGSFDVLVTDDLLIGDFVADRRFQPGAHPFKPILRPGLSRYEPRLVSAGRDKPDKPVVHRRGLAFPNSG